MAVTLDLGEWNDIHPLNKKDVGIRLALTAEKIVFKEKETNLISPVFHHLEILDRQILLYFSPLEEPLSTKDGDEPRHFAIAGQDGKFQWVRARIENNRVILYYDGIHKPKIVRYAWADNPQQANLCNSAGLPAAPFSCQINQPAD